MIEISGLSKTWEDGGEEVLRDINLTINSGEMYAIVGKSGAGKSTLLRCINGLTSYQSGSLKVDGQEVSELCGTQLREFRRNMGMIFQHFSLLERATVFQNVALPMKCWGYNKTDIKKKTSELLKLVGLENRANARPRNLSGGQKQRVAIARALTMDPKFILSDESTSALDPNTTASILELLMKINEQLGLTVVFVTHQMEVVRAACQRGCVLEDGRVASAGSIEEIFIEKPEALKRLLGEREHNLPDSGHNIQMSFHVSSVQDGTLIADMSRAIDYPVSVVDGQIMDYRGDNMGIFVINVDSAHLGAAIKFLDEKRVEYKEL